MSSLQKTILHRKEVIHRFLDISMELVATVPYDENMRKATRRQKVIVELFPSSPAALAFKTLATRITKWPIPNQPSGHLEFFIEKLVNG